MKRNKISLYLNTLWAIFSTTSNWWVLLLFLIKSKNKILTLNFIDGDHISVTNETWRSIPSLVRLKYNLSLFISELPDAIIVKFLNGQVFELQKGELFTQISSLSEVYDWDDYEIMNSDLNQKLVVDIGGFIGDTALCYAARGAVVHVFEPMNHSISAIKKNLLLSYPLSENIILHPFGLGKSYGDLIVEYNKKKSSHISLINSNDITGVSQSDNVQLVNADTYFSQLGISKVDILKIDCEGCEYELLLSTDILDKIKPDEIVMEFHRGYDSLVSVLAKNHYSFSIKGGPQVGLIFAKLTS
jgi:FkbM family methyltransferase